MSQDQTVAGQATVPASEAYAKTGRAKEKFILAQLVGKDFKRQVPPQRSRRRVERAQPAAHDGRHVARVLVLPAL